MDRQNQSQTVAQSQIEEEKSKKERVKATFSLLDRVVKAYNEGETYVKRGLTLFGLGSLIAGISFGAGQQISHQEVNAPKGLANTSTAEVQPTPQPINNPTAPTPPPSVIYLTPVPSQHSFIPTHTPVPTATPVTTTNTQLQTAPTPKPVTNTQVQSAPTPAPTPKPSTATIIPEPQPVVTQPPISSQAESVGTVLTDIQQAVEPLQQVSGLFSGFKQTVEPRSEESDDD